MKILQYGIVLLCMVTLWGCGKGNSNAPAAIDPATKKHVISGWPTPDATTGLPPHATDATGYYAQPDSCKECHGADLSGGISKLSCSNSKCHSKPFPHGQGFGAFNASNVSPHGTAAKTAVGGLMAGMAYCKKCHGVDYNGRSSAVSCIGCHRQTNSLTNAPHAGNWASYLANARGLNHSTVAESNAPACAQCHANKANLSAAGILRVAGFTTPGVGGCFDNSLCHNQAGHTFTVSGHMVPARSNLAGCQSCHATPSSGPNPVFNKIPGNNPALTPYGCETCHINSTSGTRTGLAHPYMWLPGRGTTQGLTNAASHANAQNMLISCGLCHGASLTGVGGAPSCMSTSINSTACHFTAPVNAGGTVGCKSCHGNPPDGTAAATAPNRAYNHTAHFASIASLTCDACHIGFGTGTTSHATAVTASVAIQPKFNDGGAGYTTGVCSNVSCHGGKPTPAWNATPYLNYVYDPTGYNCTANCHTVRNPAIQYIDVFNGNNNTYGTDLHDVHFNFWIVDCTDCHGIQAGKLPQSHFSGLSNGKRQFIATDPMAAGFAAGSIGGAGTQINTYTYDGTVTPVPIPRGSCLTVSPRPPGATYCHNGETRYWFNK